MLMHCSSSLASLISTSSSLHVVISLGTQISLESFQSIEARDLSRERHLLSRDLLAHLRELFEGRVELAVDLPARLVEGGRVARRRDEQ